MGKIDTLRQNIIKDLNQLSEEDLQELYAFTEFLLSKYKNTNQVNNIKLNTEENPLLKYIGGVSVESFADNIDEELYGSKTPR